ncbi:global transcription factor [Cucumis melo var. makuwa]|uniref:Global transcription factor n=1 Tax=Cucumis melo var. makuwa TaxID=1194695 RepID=A0A5D3BQV2_CUCMM|nr:global transcription factor [Cucumis melo var. makuwa]TYK01152.1 global transcription factor [Cucumis melo var. makuwa]
MSGEVKNRSGKDLPTQSSTSGQTSGKVSRDRLSRHCVGHASGKPLPTPSFRRNPRCQESLVCFPDAMYCIGKASPDRLYRASLLRNRFADTILKAREKHLKREGWRRATDGGRLKLKLQSQRRMAATDDNEDGRDGGELRTATNVSLSPNHLG